MRRPTAVSSLFSLLKLASAGAIVLAFGVACSDSNSPTAGPNGIVRIKVNSVEIDVPESVSSEAPVEESASRAVPMGPSATVLTSPSSASFALAGSCSGSGAAPGYTKSRITFAPEATPTFAPFPLTDNGYIPDSDVPLGFSFNFYGNTYDRVTVYMNGFLGFGPRPSDEALKLVTNGGSIASLALPSNIIALSWTDWAPNLAPDGIRWETRGSAPNRKFILQFINVPEKSGAGMLTSQVVLSEGSNEVTIYTGSMSIKNTSHFVTQGIENAAGTEAAYDSVVNAKTGVVTRRVKNFFSLQDDAVRFTPVRTKDEVPPTWKTAPSNLEAYNDPHLATAVVAVVPPTAEDLCSPVTVSGVRSDGVASLDAPYPVGVTTITWTAKDAEQNAITATQTVTVIDNEDPIWTPSTLSTIEVNATSLAGAYVTFDNLVASDNVGVTERPCAPESGNLFRTGYTPVTCTAWDAAGNSADLKFQVYVIGAHEQIGALMDEIKNELELPNGTLQPLLNQLKLAYTQTADGGAACKKVTDFLNMVQTKSSNLSPEDAAMLTEAATRIMHVMGCPAPAPTVKQLASYQQSSIQ
ncbi:MAG: HYR domain-containing protein [Gemmatimonadaceae bacterium]